VCNSNHGATLEAFVNQLLDSSLSNNVDVGSGFVKDDNFVLLEGSSANTDDGFLSRTKIVTVGVDMEVQE